MSKKIFIVSGGTGGHIIPAKCLANYLVKKGLEVTFIGDRNYIKYHDFKRDKFLYKIVLSSQFSKGFRAFCRFFIFSSIGILQSLLWIIAKRPKYIIAFGGYTTFPMLVAAVIFRRRIILHEQNSVLGKVNRLFAKFAYKIALTFEDTKLLLKEFKSKSYHTGIPLRPEIYKLSKSEYTLPKFKKPAINKEARMGYNVILNSNFYQKSKSEYFRILVLGGSGGAKIFSDILPKAFFNLSEEIKRKIWVTQQCRVENKEETFKQYCKLNINITVDSFFKNMPQLIKESHLIISRSGASSSFEFLCAKRPMILIPLKSSADNHQKLNAKLLKNKGAAIVIDESDFTINKASKFIEKLVGDNRILQEMSSNAAQIINLDCESKILELIK